MQRSELLREWVNGAGTAAASSLTDEGGALLVDGWWPAALRVDPTTFLVRVDDTCPEPGIADEVAAVLGAEGFRRLEGDWAIVESVTLQRLGLLGARWEVWGHDEDSARRAISVAAAGHGGVDL